ncbi:hypothetical protein [Streptomyces sp. DSM 41634]|uniref:hypothetical protein n=1 Tax=Streptomyces sp. DSM 41634 TaxID=3448656 RepID=UPI00403FED4C
MSGHPGDARIDVADQALRHRRAQEVGPPVGALGLDARRVRSHGLMDPGGHPAHLRQEHTQVDEPAGQLRPVHALQQHGQDVVAEVAAQLVGRPTRGHLLRALAEFLLLAGEAFWGGAADRVGDGHHQAVGHRRSLRRVGV